VAPAPAVPEITTFCPARDGLGEAEMVRPETTHGAVGQQALPEEAGQHVVVQHCVVAQQGVV
jgi:hypothetical protein